MIDKIPTITFLSFDEQNEQKLDFTISVNKMCIHHNLRVETFPAKLTSIFSLRVKSLQLNLGCFDYTRKIFEAPTMSFSRFDNSAFGLVIYLFLRLYVFCSICSTTFGKSKSFFQHFVPWFLVGV